MPSACAVSWMAIRSCALARRVGVDDDPLRWVGRTSLRCRRACARTRRRSRASGKRGGGLDRCGVAVAGERLARRLQRRGLAAVARVDLERSKTGTARKSTRAVLLSVVVTLASARHRGHRGEDPDRVFAFADAVAEFEPGLEASDEAGVRGWRAGSGRGSRPSSARGPLLARARTQRCQPSDESSCSQACLRRSRSRARRCRARRRSDDGVLGHRAGPSRGAPPGAAPAPPRSAALRAATVRGGQVPYRCRDIRSKALGPELAEGVQRRDVALWRELTRSAGPDVQWSRSRRQCAASFCGSNREGARAMQQLPRGEMASQHNVAARAAVDAALAEAGAQLEFRDRARLRRPRRVAARLHLHPRPARHGLACPARRAVP